MLSTRDYGLDVQGIRHDCGVAVVWVSNLKAPPDVYTAAGSSAVVQYTVLYAVPYLLGTECSYF